MHFDFSKPYISIYAPGRVNIIGEHTDYNDGFVLPAAIDKKVVFRIQKNGTHSQVNVIAKNLDEVFCFDLQNFSPLQSGWQNYIMGVVHELQNLGAKFSGFDAEFESDVPIGSGMSSSAALECSLAFGLNELFILGFEKLQLIKACQLAEHHYVGVECGIMDQFASMMGKRNHAVLLDCRSLEHTYFPLELGDYQILLLDTNVPHSLAISAYNTRRAECEEGVELLQKAWPNIMKLRDVSFAQLISQKAKLPDHIYCRCLHVVSENRRVLDATNALLEMDHLLLGQLMYQSHASLQNAYEVSCAELDYLVQQTIDKTYILGSRMMGGGFGGCTINIIENGRVAEFVETAAKNYQAKFGKWLTAYRLHVEDGAGSC